jgi:ankyrin repeat protein
LIRTIEQAAWPDLRLALHTLNEGGQTALYLAALLGHIEVVKVLLNAKANVNAKNREGRTALHQAAYEGRVEAVKVLLNAEAKVSAEDQHGNTALHEAAWQSHVEVVKVLLNAKANVNAKNREGRTAIGLTYTGSIIWSILRVARMEVMDTIDEGIEKLA